MIIEFELQGSKCLHKGAFDTTGFWVKYEPELDGDIVRNNKDQIFGAYVDKIVGYKIFSHFSFAFYHEEKVLVDSVYTVLMGCLRGSPGKDIPGVGFIKKLNK